jgi:hypothetical protein
MRSPLPHPACANRCRVFPQEHGVPLLGVVVNQIIPEKRDMVFFGCIRGGGLGRAAVSDLHCACGSLSPGACGRVGVRNTCMRAGAAPRPTPPHTILPRNTLPPPPLPIAPCRQIVEYFGKALRPWGVPLLGAIPFKPELRAPSIADLTKLLKAQLISAEHCRLRQFSSIRLAVGFYDEVGTAARPLRAWHRLRV